MLIAKLLVHPPAVGMDIRTPAANKPDERDVEPSAISIASERSPCRR
jgi:hypothetical protein